MYLLSKSYSLVCDVHGVEHCVQHHHGFFIATRRRIGGCGLTESSSAASPPATCTHWTVISCQSLCIQCIQCLIIYFSLNDTTSYKMDIMLYSTWSSHLLIVTRESPSAPENTFLRLIGIIFIWLCPLLYTVYAQVSTFHKSCCLCTWDTGNMIYDNSPNITCVGGHHQKLHCYSLFLSSVCSLDCVLKPWE